MHFSQSKNARLLNCFSWLQILESNKNWWRAVNITRQVGFVPCTILKRLKLEDVSHLGKVAEHSDSEISFSELKFNEIEEKSFVMITDGSSSCKII